MPYLIFLCAPVYFFNAPYAVRYKVAESFSYIFIFLAKTLCGIKYEVIGQEKIPTNGNPYLFLSNHQSFWENMFLQLILPKHSWIMKKELFNIPVFGWGLRIVEPIAIDRNVGISVMQILSEGQKKIDQGLSIVMYPEGGTVRTDRNVKFKPSAAKLAINSNIPMVLIAHNSGVCWPKGFWFRRPGLVIVKILEVVPIKKYKDYDVRTLTDYIEERINEEKETLVRQAE